MAIARAAPSTSRQAIDAYHSALLEITHTARAARLGQGTKLQPGHRAREELGERDSSTEHLQQAVDAFNSALLEITRERVPLDWAGTQVNLGLALESLGERETGTEHLQQAVEADNSALLEITRQRVPLQWAYSSHGLAIALEQLGMRTHSPELLAEALIHMAHAAEIYRTNNITAWLPVAADFIERSTGQSSPTHSLPRGQPSSRNAHGFVATEAAGICGIATSLMPASRMLARLASQPLA